MLVDAHVHCTDLEGLETYTREGKLTLVCVADDPLSSNKIVEISRQHPNVEPCVGIHPWLAHEYSVRETINLLKKYVSSNEILCLGEVGLDKRFKPDTFKNQLELFKVFVEYAREYDLVLNLHAADAWREVFELVYEKNVNRVYFHWYTGPLELLYQIENIGYYIGANPAWRIQQKHRIILESANLKNILTESDAPYNYRGLLMTPRLIEDTIKHLSDIKKLNRNAVEEQVYNNFKKLFRKK